MVPVTCWPRRRADERAGDALAAVSLAPNEGSGVSAKTPGHCWTGAHGLPDELWEKILAHAGAAEWARARAACRELRLLGMVPSVLRAQQERWGVGRRLLAAGEAPDFAAVLGLMARRGRLEANLARRQLYVDLAPAQGQAPAESVVLPDLTLLTIDARGEPGLRALSAGSLDAPAVVPPLASQDRVGPFRYSGLRPVSGRCLGFVSPPPFFFWREAGALSPVRGWLDCGPGDPALIAISGDAGRGLALVGEDEVVAGNQRGGEVWRWRPRQTPGWHLGRPSPSLVAGALPGAGDSAVLLDAGPALTGWRLGGEAPALAWGPLPVAGPPESALGATAGALAGRGGLVASHDGRHLVAVPPGRGPLGVVTSGPPSLLSLTDGGSVAAGPWPLRAAADEDELCIDFSLDGGCLAVAVARPDGGFEARHWRLGGDAGRPQATVFARGDEPIAHLSLSPDGALAAVAAGSQAVMGTVALWRLDGPAGPDLVWDFKPGHVVYRRVVFSHTGDELVLVPVLGGALVVRLAVDGRAAQVGENFVAPGRPFRDVSSYYLDYISRMHFKHG